VPLDTSQLETTPDFSVSEVLQASEPENDLLDKMVQYLPSSTREYLKNDIASLVRDFGDVTNLDSVKVQVVLIPI